MKTHVWTAAVLCLAIAPTVASEVIPGKAAEEWVFPGEYESQQAIWMLWPTLENKAGFPSTEPMADMVRALGGHTHVNLAVQDADDEAGARDLLAGAGVPLDHVHFFHLEHGDIWARDMGPQFTRSSHGRLRVNDWNFNMWGFEEPESDNSSFEEAFDRNAAAALRVGVLRGRPGPTGVRMVHEGGSASHNGRGTMIAVESVVIQRNLGPGRFCGGQAPVTDFGRPNTYAPNPDWPACRALVEQEYRRMLGVKKFIWIPTGVIEDQGTFRGALGKHIHVPEHGGAVIPHAGVYTMFTTNGHPDEVVRFVAPDTVVLAEQITSPSPLRTPAEKLARWLEDRNRERLARVHAILSRETTESGEPIRVVRIPTPIMTFDVIQPGDGLHDYFSGYDRWEDGSTTPDVMLTVWPGSYVNYVVTNDLVLVSRFWKPGRSPEHRRRDEAARSILGELFPGREVVSVYTENVNRGGGGMNCITQQQPASARFVEACGWAKVQVAAGATTLYDAPVGGGALGLVRRLGRSGDDVYLERRSSWGQRVQVRVGGGSRLEGAVGWVDEADVESAGEKCPNVYAPN